MKIYEILKVMSSENKAKLITKLIYCNNCSKKSVSDICAEIGLKQSCLSKHLMELRKMGIIKSSKNGRKVFYKIDQNFEDKWGKLIKNIIFSENKLKSIHCGCK